MHELVNYLSVMDETAFNIVMLLLAVAAFSIWQAKSFLTTLFYVPGVSFFAILALYAGDDRNISLLDETYSNVVLVASAGVVAGLAVMLTLHILLNAAIDAMQSRSLNKRRPQRRVV